MDYEYCKNKEKVLEIINMYLSASPDVQEQVKEIMSVFLETDNKE